VSLRDWFNLLLESRKISYWYPKGSTVISTVELGDRSVSPGHVVD